MFSELCFRYNVSYMDEYAGSLREISDVLLHRGHEDVLLFLLSMSSAVHIGTENVLQHLCGSSQISDFIEEDTFKNTHYATDWPTSSETDSLSEHGEVEPSEMICGSKDLLWTTILPPPSVFITRKHTVNNASHPEQYWLGTNMKHDGASISIDLADITKMSQRNVIAERDFVREILFELSSPKYQMNSNNVQCSHLSQGCLTYYLQVFRDVGDRVRSLMGNSFVHKYMLDLISVKITRFLQCEDIKVVSLLRLEKEFIYIIFELAKLVQVTDVSTCGARLIDSLEYMIRKRKVISADACNNVETDIFMHHLCDLFTALNFGLKTREHTLPDLPLFLSELSAVFQSISAMCQTAPMKIAMDIMDQTPILPNLEEEHFSDFDEFIGNIISSCKETCASRQKSHLNHIMSNFNIFYDLKKIWDVLLCRNGLLITEYVREILPFIKNLGDFRSRSVFSRICDDFNIIDVISVKYIDSDDNGWLDLQIEVKTSNVFLSQILSRPTIIIYNHIFNLTFNLKIALAQLTYCLPDWPIADKMLMRKVLTGFESYVQTFVIEKFVKDSLADSSVLTSWNELLERHNKFLLDVKSLLFLGQKASALNLAFRRLICLCLSDSKKVSNVQHDIDFLRTSLQKIRQIGEGGVHFDYLLSMIH